MNSSETSRMEIHVNDKMLKEFRYLVADHGFKKASGILLQDQVGVVDLDSVNDIYMKEQSIVYYIEGPAWRHDDYLLERSWLKGFEAACSLAGQPFVLKFTIDQFCVSKMHVPLPENDD